MFKAVILRWWVTTPLGIEPFWGQMILLPKLHDRFPIYQIFIVRDKLQQVYHLPGQEHGD